MSVVVTQDEGIVMDKSLRRVPIVGLGKLGVPMAACFASKGFLTIGVDVEPARVDALTQGQNLHRTKFFDYLGRDAEVIQS